MTLDDNTGDLDIELYDREGDLLTGSYGSDDDEAFIYTFTAADVAPYYINVYVYSEYSDYDIDCSFGVF